MNIPSLPVDSIYKFSAFAGLATILFCLYTYSSLVETIQEKGLKVQLELKKTEIEIRFIQTKVKKIDGLVKAMTKGTTASDILKEGKTPIGFTTGEFKTMVSEFGQLLHDEDIQSVELGILIQELGALESRRRSYFAIASVAIISGFALSLWGFVFWHIRIQRYQDQIIRNEATKSKTISL
jgi:hypothetical protein